ncbi:Trk system potassium uptake protein TrkH [Planctomycetes bacterium Pan216]|uniref:Trk system potassium uptake protein TrkH n=1 Tax=Kolteria novifilia TaxID=2527975 RepID=A0A518B5N2_9BACT|nr:Trk system potassium uptake protein TrkH [Planctomycetes bacterium Pan216]
MNLSLTLKLLGGLTIFEAVVLIIPMIFSLVTGDRAFFPFLCSILLAGACGLFVFRRYRVDGYLTHREGFAVVTFGWIVFALFGSLPYVFSGSVDGPVDGFFEAMSGFTTTGSTVITDLDQIPRSILLWRSMTQWLGGMGIIVLSLAILPFLGVGGMQLFEAEVPGPTADRLSPRIQDTAKVLWAVYVIITAAEVLLLWLGPMDLFEAICHSLTTMATGGFGTLNNSITGFQNSYVDVVVTFFMFLAGVNFALHYQLLRGRPLSLWRNEEFWTYTAITLGSVMVLVVLNRTLYSSVLINLRDAAFTTTSLLTTTGFATADYENWPVTSQYLLVTLMFLGGCAGSTAGGMKIVRVLLVTKHAYLQIARLIHPRQVKLLKLDGKPVSQEVIQAILGFVALWMFLFLIGSLLMAGFGLDLVSAGAAVIACLGNIGPGLGEVGPTDNFAFVPQHGKLLLCLLMLVGRLEVFTVLVLFFPSFWKK